MTQPVTLVTERWDRGGWTLRDKNASADDRFHVLGIPRVNLERLMTFGGQEPGSPVSVKGAYEMIIMGVFEND